LSRQGEIDVAMFVLLSQRPHEVLTPSWSFQ